MLHETFAEVHRDHKLAVTRRKREREKLQERLKQIYVDRLDGQIEDALFDALTVEFRDPERKVARELQIRFDADFGHMEDGAALLFDRPQRPEAVHGRRLDRQKHLLSVVLSNCSFRDGILSAEYRKPFGILAEYMPEGDRADIGQAAKTSGSPKWQSFVDDIRTSFWEEADDIAARALSLRLVGALS